MPIAHSEVIEFLRAGINTAFFKMFDTYKGASYELAATVIPSTTDIERYRALGSAPMLSETKAEKKRFGTGPAITYDLANKDYDGTISVHKNEISDEKYGQILARAGQLGAKAKKSMDKFVFGFIHDGATNKCYDGLALFADTHGPASDQDNKLDLALSKANLETAITTMEKFVDDLGEPMGLVPDTLIVNPSLLVAARELLNATTLVTNSIDVDGTTTFSPNYNGLNGMLPNLIVSPYLTSATEWYVACTSEPIKPVILQERAPITLDEDTSELFKNGYRHYAATWRGNTGCYDWRTIVRGKA